MAKFDNNFVPKFVPNNLKQYETYRMDRQYLEGKCRDFLEDKNEHFKAMNVINFDMINNKVSKDQIKQYQTLEYHEIMCFSPKICEEIFSSIFRHIKRNGMHVKK